MLNSRGETSRVGIRSEGAAIVRESARRFKVE
jgi:hypothetical protein